MPRPKSLTLGQIAAAALSLIERDGLAELSMRSVAAELGVGTMSLYRYVESREQLEALIVAELFAEIELSTNPRANWQTRISLLAKRLREAVAEHPAVVPLLVSRGHGSEQMVRWLESLLELLDAAGLAGVERTIAARALGGYLIGAVQLEHLAPLHARPENFARLPRETFPRLHEAAAHGREITPDQEFQRGLDIVLRGLKKQAAR